MSKSECQCGAHETAALHTRDRVVKAALALVKGLAWDVGLPVVAYYVLRAFGASEWVALLASAVLAAARVAWTALRERSLNLFATVMLVVYGLGFVLAFLAGDPRFLLLKASFVTGSVGLAFLGTVLLGSRPLTLAAEQSWNPDRAAEIAEEFRTEPAARRAHRFASTVWGVGLLVEAIVRIPLIYLLPIDVMVGVSTAMLVVTFAALGVWTVRFATRKRAAAGPAVT